jgi:hypothetical protein
MPCNESGGHDHLYQEISFLSAALCALLRSTETAFPSADRFAAALDEVIDWREAGIEKDRLLAWWEDHKRRDLERREREAAAARAAEDASRARILLRSMPPEDAELLRRHFKGEK